MRICVEFLMIAGSPQNGDGVWKMEKGPHRGETTHTAGAIASRNIGHQGTSR